jgi:hypothetical protein
LGIGARAAKAKSIQFCALPGFFAKSPYIIVAVEMRVGVFETGNFLPGPITGCPTSRVTLLLKVVSQLSVDQYCSAWAHFKALFVLYTFDK